MDNLVGEVEVFNATDRYRLIVTEVKRVGVRIRVDVDLADVKEGTIREVHGVGTAAANDRVVVSTTIDRVIAAIVQVHAVGTFAHGDEYIVVTTDHVERLATGVVEDDRLQVRRRLNRRGGRHVEDLNDGRDRSPGE